MDTKKNLKVVFIVGSDRASTRIAIENVCALPNIEPVGAILEIERVGLYRRFNNLRKNVRKQGWKYLPFRLIEGIRECTDRLVENAVVSHKEVGKLLHAAFPERCFSISELGQKYRFAETTVSNLNSEEAIRALKAFNADLGIVVGTRVLKEGTFTVPKMGCINLHKGKVPDYRGLPPGFWELYDGAASVGVTVHFVDKGLDTGDIVATSEVSILRMDTPESLLEKLHREGARVLASAVASIQAGTVQRQAQGGKSVKARSKPTRTQIRQLQRMLPHWKHQNDLSILIKNSYCLLAYYSGLYAVLRLWHRSFGATRCAVLLYHRVNDFSKDVLTVDTETFAAQLLALAQRYSRMSTTELVNRIKSRQAITPTSIVVHFDDCYRDAYANGAPILAAAGFSAAAFVSSGFVGTERAFAHDVEKYPFKYENFQPSEIRDWMGHGFEIGAHTVNHVDLGKCPLDQVKLEVRESLCQLEAVTGNTVTYFSFPFGRPHNIRDEAIQVIREAGCSALFSAHGGFVGPKTNLYDIPRIGVSHEARPLFLLIEIEGLAPNQIVSSTKAFLARLLSRAPGPERATAENGR